MRTLFKAIVATAALVAPMYANAIPMTWTYTGACDAGDCDVVPSITGSLSGDPGILWPYDELNEVLIGDVTSYDFWIGSYHLSGNVALGSYQLDGAGNITGGSMTFGDLATLEFLGVGTGRWTFSDSSCFLIFCRTDVEASGSGSYARVTSVPEPATLSLLGLGLLGLGVARRPRRS
jgi:hypothetical protein